MARVTIYVPDGLKARMDQLGDTINWSAAAQEAFQSLVQSQEWKQMSNRIEAAAARMKASKMRYICNEEEAGKREGREWVIENAEYEDMEKIRNFETMHYDLHSDECYIAGDLSEMLVDDRDDLWEEVLGERGKWPSTYFTSGFIIGALEAIAEIEKSANGS